MYKQVVGQMGRVVLAQFDKDEDLMEGIHKVLRDQNIRTGYVASITGALRTAKIQRFPENPTPERATVTVNLDGPLEVSGHGIIGIVEAPEQGDKPFALSGNVHGDPYVHVHLTVTNVKETICGHLMKGGNLVNSFHPVSHFTIFIVEVVGAELQIRCDAERGRAPYHFITEVAVANA